MLLITLVENLYLMRLIYFIALLTFFAFVSAYSSESIKISEIALFALWLFFASLIGMLIINLTAI